MDFKVKPLDLIEDIGRHLKWPRMHRPIASIMTFDTLVILDKILYNDNKNNKDTLIETKFLNYMFINKFASLRVGEEGIICLAKSVLSFELDFGRYLTSGNGKTEKE